MKKINPYLVAGILSVLVLVGMMIPSMNDISPETNEPYGIDLPILGILIFGGLFYLGYNAGKFKKQKEDGTRPS